MRGGRSGGSEQDLDEDQSFGVSTSGGSSPSASSQSWIFPAYEGPASPSVAGQLSHTQSPYRPGHSKWQASDTARELDSILGHVRTSGGGGGSGAWDGGGGADGAVRSLVGKASEIARTRKSADDWSSEYSSLMTSLRSLSEIEQGLEDLEAEDEDHVVLGEESEEEQHEEKGVLGARGASSTQARQRVELGVGMQAHEQEAQADKSLEEARELQGLSSLRASDDLITLRMREQQMVDLNTGQPWETVKLTALGTSRTIFEEKYIVTKKEAA